jgi:hypothetical protein
MIRTALVALPKSPMNLAQGDEVPQIITRRTRQRPSEFLTPPAKRLLQHNRHQTDMTLELGDVRYWMNSGKHLLAVSFSDFDPTRTSTAQSGRSYKLYEKVRDHPCRQPASFAKLAKNSGV